MRYATLSGLALASLICTAALAAPPDPGRLQAAFERATGDRAAVQALLTERFGADDFARVEWLDRAARGASVTVQGVRAEGDRAVMTLVSGGSPVVLLAVATPAGWRIDDWTTDPGAAIRYLAGKPRLAPRDPALWSFGDRLAHAIETRNAPALLAATHPDALEGDKRREAGLFWQFLHKTLSLRVRDARSTNGRGVIDADVLRGERPVDRIQLIAVARPPTWQIAEITENPMHAAAWLAGDAPARLDVTGLPGQPEVEALAGRIRDAMSARDGDALAAWIGEASGETPGMGAPRLRGWVRGEALRAVDAVGQPRVHHRAKGDRAIAEITLARTGDGRRVQEPVTLYFERVDGRWRWIDLGFVTHRAWVFGLTDR